jgi:hypothetical protein
MASAVIMASAVNMVSVAAVTLTGNAKRVASCTKIGGEKKRIGHEREKDFTKQFDVENTSKPTEYGATSDTKISIHHPTYQKLVEKLNIKGNNVSNKSGKSIQFTLGNIPELANENNNLDTIKNPEESKKIFKKYLKKSESKEPADILVYKDVNKKCWYFFNMDTIIDYIVKNCEWRKLSSGRIKGDFKDSSKKGVRQYLTYEYRRNKGFFLGLNGNAGYKFIELLMDKEHGIPFHTEPIITTLETSTQ